MAGVTSTVTCFPLEVVRTRLACSSEYGNMFQAVSVIARKEGLGAFYGGLGPSVVGVPLVCHAFAFKPRHVRIKTDACNLPDACRGHPLRWRQLGDVRWPSLVVPVGVWQ